MKHLIALLILLMPVTVCAATINFSWDANTETDLAGYRMYQSNESGVYDMDTPVAEIAETETTYTLPDVTDGTYFWVLTAYDNAGNESDPSNEVTLTVDETAPAPPSGFMGWIQEVISWLRGVFGGLKAEVG